MFNEELYIVPIDRLNAASIRQFGGKAANLGELSRLPVLVPPGVAIGKHALAFFLQDNAISIAELERIHNLGMTFLESVISEIRDTQEKIIAILRQAAFPTVVADRIFTCLGEVEARRFAVRSSCIVEDAISTSFAGQYVTILDVSTRDGILAAIRSCWISQYDGRALTYAIARRGMPILVPSMGVVVQQMIDPDYAGVCFTQGPTKKTAHLTVIESVPGCGESLVSGTRTPTHFELDASGKIERVVESRNEPLQKPPDAIISMVAKASQKIADHFQCPQDVEWATAGEVLYILQTRPITTLVGERGQVRSISPGVGGRSTTSGSDEGERVPNHSLTDLRDDLHEWLIAETDPLIYRGTSYLLTTQREDGSWGVDGHLEWTAPATALVVQLLIRGGIPPTLRWSVPRGGRESSFLGLPRAVDWIVSNVKEDGTWGSDLWDTCQVIRALIKCGVKPGAPVIRKGLEFVAQDLAREFEGSKDQEWFGTGFLSAIVSLFTEIGREEDAAYCAKLLLASQAPSGEFLGPSAQRNGSRVPSEWHTGQAISALASCAGTSAPTDAIKRACAWLLARQHDNGSWGQTDTLYSGYNAFFTAFAVMALTDAGYSESNDSITKALKWMRGRQLASGGFGDLGSSLMTMAAFQRLRGHIFTVTLPIPLFLRIQATLAATNAPVRGQLTPKNGGDRNA